MMTKFVGISVSENRCFQKPKADKIAWCLHFRSWFAIACSREMLQDYCSSHALGSNWHVAKLAVSHVVITHKQGLNKDRFLRSHNDVLSSGHFSALPAIMTKRTSLRSRFFLQPFLLGALTFTYLQRIYAYIRVLKKIRAPPQRIYVTYLPSMDQKGLME